jgi:hypothetical protein
MPFHGEFASYGPLRRLAANTRIQELFRDYEIQRPPAAGDGDLPGLIAAADLEYEGWVPDYIIALDGSELPVQLQNGYPGAEMYGITVSSVLLDMQRLQHIDAKRPVDPIQYRAATESESIDCAMPSTNVIVKGEPDPAASLRRVIADLLAGARMSEGQESLLDTYEALLALKPETGHKQRCPYDDCQDASQIYRRGTGVYACPCPLARRLQSSDALRFTEGMNPGGSNGAMFAEILQVLERLWIVHILRTFLANGWAASLGRLAILMDGPLGVFGHPAWLAPAIEHELTRINAQVKAITGQDMLLLGIEKSGPFVDHFMLLDQHDRGAQGRFPNRSAMLLDDAYIKRHIIPSESTKQYGADTYFGRKFFYKNHSGARLVAVLPFLEAGQNDLSRADPDRYPRLADSLHLLDRLFSSRYENAVSALVAANAAAAIPRSMGQKVFERLARELMAR